MTGFQRLTLAIELIEAGVRSPHIVAGAAQISDESAGSLIDALDREGHGAMVEFTRRWVFPGSADRKPLGQRLN
jgi:hypothetical protein